MTVSTTINRKEYTGDAVSTSFAFSYPVLLAADLKVYQNGTLKTLTTHYTLSGSAPYTSGTNVQFLSAPAVDDEIVILRDPAITQAVDLTDGDNLPAASVETPLDRLTMICQRLRDQLDRSFTLSDSDVSGASLELPTPAASKLIGWDEDGLALANYASASIVDTIVPTAFMETLLDDTTAAAARTTLGAAASGANTDLTSVYLNNTGLKIKDTNATHGLSIVPGSNITADRALSLVTGDADRTLTISGDTTLGGGSHSGTNTGDLAGHSAIVNTLAADVALNNTGSYFTGPTIAQGTTGTWFASGTVTLEDTAGGSEFRVKLWDGTTVIASAVLSIPNANDPVPVHLSGYLASPAANIRISVKDISTTSGQIRFNSSGESKDATLCAFRIA